MDITFFVSIYEFVVNLLFPADSYASLAMPLAIPAAMLGAAAITGASNLIGGLFNSSSSIKTNKANVAMTRETNAMNYRIFREQNDFNEAMLQKQLDYNLPKNQVQRLEEAGINPYLALGNISTGSQQSALNSAPAPSMQSPQVQPNFGLGDAVRSFGNDFANLALSLSQAKKNDAEAASVMAQTQWIDRMNQSVVDKNSSSSARDREDTRGMKQQNDFFSDTLAQRRDLMDTSVDQAKATLGVLREQSRKMKIESDLLQLDLDFKNKYGEQRYVSELANIIADTAKKYEDVAMSRYQRTSYMPGMLSVAQFNAQSQRMLTIGQCKKMAAEVSMIAEEKAGIKLDNEQKSKIQDYIVENYKLDYNRHALEREAQSGEHGIGYYGNMILDYLGNKISNGLRFNFGH